VTLLAQLTALLAIVSTGVVYGTDAFCALVQRPALARVDDATLTAIMALRSTAHSPRPPTPTRHRPTPAHSNASGTASSSPAVLQGLAVAALGVSLIS